MDEYKKYEPIFGSWYLKRLIGKGSFGKVFEITREEYGTTYRSALKIITVPQDEDDVKARMSEGSSIESVTEYYESILKEIINENEIMSKLKGNSNIVSYEDHQIIPHEDGIGYDILIRMELLTPLLDRMLNKKLDEKEVVKLGIDICKALEVCHRKNIIHRDIKPQNIFISDNGDFKLGDFGIARTMEKTTGGMSKKGTYKYMAPEVFRGEHYDSTVDLYSLGIVLFSLLNGNRGPFLTAPPAKVTPAQEEEARMRRFRGEPIPAPRDAGVMLSYIIKKACEADPAKRYRTAEQMKKDLESYLANYEEQSVMPYGEAEKTVYEDSTGYAGMRGTAAGAYAGSTGSRFTGQYTQVQPDPRVTGRYAAPPQAEPRYTGQYPPVQPYAAAPVEQPAKKGGGFKAVAIILCAMLLAGAATFGVVKYLQSRDSGGGSVPGSSETGGNSGGGSDDGGGSGLTPEQLAAIEDATEYNGHHYQVFSDSMRWDQAAAACEEKGGHLVCIEDAAEQAFIEGLIKSSGSAKLHFWLGGSKDGDTWVWLSGVEIPDPTKGDTWGYENWERNKKGEPDKPNNNKNAAKYTGDENYIELQTTNNGNDYMTWNDIDMDGNADGYLDGPEYNSQEYFGYIIEWDF